MNTIRESLDEDTCGILPEDVLVNPWQGSPLNWAVTCGAIVISQPPSSATPGCLSREQGSPDSSKVSFRRKELQALSKEAAAVTSIHHKLACSASFRARSASIRPRAGTHCTTSKALLHCGSHSNIAAEVETAAFEPFLLQSSPRPLPGAKRCHAQSARPSKAMQCQTQLLNTCAGKRTSMTLMTAAIVEGRFATSKVLTTYSLIFTSFLECVHRVPWHSNSKLHVKATRAAETQKTLRRKLQKADASALRAPSNSVAYQL
jgi:hypothetical protein